MFNARSASIPMTAWTTALTAALLVATPAAAEPSPVAPPPTPDIPSGSPATTTTVDGWTLTLTANSETRLPAPSLDPTEPSRDYIVGGLFNGTLRDAGGSEWPRPTGSIEAGYQVQCVPAGMLSAMRPASVSIPVIKEDFTGANPSAAITSFRVQVDCLGPALLRSYAILTRTTDTTDSVVAYYGVSTPA